MLPTDMVALALAAASCAAALVAWPGRGAPLAVGLAILAVATGLIVWRRVAARPATRLAGAAAVALGSVTLLLGATKVALTFVAIERLARVLH